MSIFRVPAVVTALTGPDPVHWHLVANEDRPGGFACGKPVLEGRGSYTSEQTTCADCLAVIVRRHCNAIAPEPGPLPARCGMAPHEGEHDWEREEVVRIDQRRATVQRLAADSFAAGAERDRICRRQGEESQHPELAEVSGWEDDGGTQDEREVIETWAV